MRSSKVICKQCKKQEVEGYIETIGYCRDCYDRLRYKMKLKRTEEKRQEEKHELKKKNSP